MDQRPRPGRRPVGRPALTSRENLWGCSARTPRYRSARSRRGLRVPRTGRRLPASRAADRCISASPRRRPRSTPSRASPRAWRWREPWPVDASDARLHSWAFAVGVAADRQPILHSRWAGCSYPLTFQSGRFLRTEHRLVREKSPGKSDLIHGAGRRPAVQAGLRRTKRW